MSFFTKLWAWIKPIGPKIAYFLEPFGRLIAQAGGALLTDIALDAVTTVAKTGLTNEAKRKEAFKIIKANAESKGIKATENLINAVLELAVMKIKS